MFNITQQDNTERQESIQKLVRAYERSRPDPKRAFEQISMAW